MKNGIYLLSIVIILIISFTLLTIVFFEERASENGTAPCWVYHSFHKQYSPFSMNTSKVQETINKCNLKYGATQ